MFFFSHFMFSWNGPFDLWQDFFRWVCLPVRPFLVTGLLCFPPYFCHQRNNASNTWNVLLCCSFLFYLLFCSQSYNSLSAFLYKVLQPCIMQPYYIKYYCVHAITFNILLLLPFSSSAIVLYVCLFFSVFIVAEQK